MKLAKDYDSVMGRSAEIMKASLGLDFNDFESGSVAFDLSLIHIYLRLLYPKPQRLK